MRAWHRTDSTSLKELLSEADMLRGFNELINSQIRLTGSMIA